MSHLESHPLHDEIVMLVTVARDPRGVIQTGEMFRVEDWVDRLGKSWREQENWATHHYFIRQALNIVLPDDDEVVYGHIGRLGHCVHQSEL